MRTFGIEEEYLLVDPESGEAVAGASALLRLAARLKDATELVAEFQQEMVETSTSARETLDELRGDIARGRQAADDRAATTGARAVALASSPLLATPHPTDEPRYQEMVERFQVTARHSLTCGMHVHVGIESREEGVAILDRIRDWLPLVVALSANSPLRDGEDTGYASYRTISWREWPTAGPTPVFGSADAYDRFEDEMLATEVPVDRGMLYFDARLSRNNPTVEVRVADVCLYQADAVTVAGIIRGLVDTAARESLDGVLPIGTTASVLRLGAWQAAREGMSGRLVHPVSRVPVSAADAFDALLEHIAPALRATGDLDAVTQGLEQIVRRGTGAEAQRAMLSETGNLPDVVREAVRLTHSPSA